MPTHIDSQNSTPEKWNAESGLECLAPEILLNIVTRLPDLVSLDSLLGASPASFRLFDNNAVEITEAILSTGFICGHIRVIIRIIALIRSSTLPIHNLSEFQNKIIREALRYSSRVRRSREGFAPEYLAKDTKSAIIRSILATARLLTWVSLDCLKFYLVRFKALRPDQLVNDKYKFYSTAIASGDKDYIPAWQSRPKGRKFDVRDVGPPSWIEEQRVTRAFWRLQLIYDLKTAAANSLLSWPEKEIEALNNSEPVNFYGPEMHLAQGEYEPNPPEYEEINSIIEYTQEVQGQDPAIHLAHSRLWLSQMSRPREVQRDWPIPAPGRKDWRKLVDPSPGCIFYFTVTYSVNAGIYSPLKFVPFDLFRRFGLHSGRLRDCARMDFRFLLRQRDIFSIEEIRLTTLGKASSAQMRLPE